MVTAVQTADARESILASLNQRSGGKTVDDGGTANRFLTLLVTQMRNQDPLNPMDNAQVTSQLAQISTVDGIERLNESIQKLMSDSSATQLMQAAALVGHGVMVPGNGLKVYQGSGTAGFELSQPADRVIATVRDANGLVMRNLALGARAAGSHAFQWDGKTDAGQTVVDGAYTVSAEAWRGDSRVSAGTLELGRVTGVVRDGAAVSLEVGTLGMFGLPDVRQII